MEREFAEPGEPAVGEIAATVEVVEALLVGVGEGGMVVGLVAGETARERPESVGVGLGFAQPGVGEEAGDAPVAVEKGMNPRKPVVRGDTPAMRDTSPRGISPRRKISRSTSAAPEGSSPVDS